MVVIGIVVPMKGSQEDTNEGKSSNSSVSRRTTLKALSTGAVGVGSLSAMTGEALAGFSLDFTVYTGDSMDTVADFLGDGTFGPANWVEDYFNTYWPNVGNISGTSSTVSYDLVPDGNFSTDTCDAFLNDFDSWVNGRSDESSDTNVLLTNVSSVGCGGIAEAACTGSDSQDSCTVFEAGDMYHSSHTVDDQYEFDSDGDGSWTNADWGRMKMSTAFMEAGHNLGYGHLHGDADNFTSPNSFTPLMGGYADPDTSPNCCGQDNYCAYPVDCIEIYNDNCKVDYTLDACVEDEGGYPGYPFCSNDGVDSCPGGLALSESGKRYLVSVPSPHADEETISVPTPERGSRRTVGDARKRQQERGPTGSDVIIPHVTDRYVE